MSTPMFLLTPNQRTPIKGVHISIPYTQTHYGDTIPNSTQYKITFISTTNRELIIQSDRDCTDAKSLGHLVQYIHQAFQKGYLSLDLTPYLPALENSTVYGNLLTTRLATRIATRPTTPNQSPTQPHQPKSLSTFTISGVSECVYLCIATPITFRATLNRQQNTIRLTLTVKQSETSKRGIHPQTQTYPPHLVPVYTLTYPPNHPRISPLFMQGVQSELEDYLQRHLNPTTLVDLNTLLLGFTLTRQIKPHLQVCYPKR